MLNRLNSHGIGLAGLAIGGASIVGSVYALFGLFTSKDGPQYLVALAFAADHLARHEALTSTDQLALAQLACALIGILGAIVVALLLSWLGRPVTVPSSPANGAVKAPTSPPEKDT